MEERNIRMTQGGNWFHPEFGLCESCQDIFTPALIEFCQRCGAFQHGREVTDRWCRRCENQKFWFDRVVPFAKYQGDFRLAVLQMKRPSGNALTRAFARLFAENRLFLLKSVQADVILPVPMHPFYRWVRGTNDAEILADELGKILRLPVDERIVRCKRMTLAQRAVQMRKRSENVKGMFGTYSSKPDRTRWLGKRALLVDDVMTTGSTVNEVAFILKTELGFADVSVAVLTRARGNIKSTQKGIVSVAIESRLDLPFQHQHWIYRKGQKPVLRRLKPRSFNKRRSASKKKQTEKKKKESNSNDAE